MLIEDDQGTSDMFLYIILFNRFYILINLILLNTENRANLPMPTRPQAIDSKSTNTIYQAIQNIYGAFTFYFIK